MLCDGFLIIDKPYGISSRKLLDRIKPFTDKKLGHTGTLDPLATGMMVIAIQDATRFSSWIISQDKAYEAVIQLGAQTETDDQEGEIIAQSDHIPSLESINTALKKFIGDISQRPPNYSAIHVNGKRAYELARNNKPVNLKARPITIYDIQLKTYDPNTRLLKLYIHCQSGTYIRSIARDLGIDLNCYGNLFSLKRLWVSPFEEHPMIQLEDLPKPSLPLDHFFKTLAHVELSREQGLDLAHGKMITLDDTRELAAFYKDTFIGMIAPKDGYYKSIKLRSNVLKIFT
jgi:tRNA pseudouridine55 synthase